MTVCPSFNLPISKSPGLTDLSDAINYNEIFDQISTLNLCIYTPSKFILASKVEKYEAIYGKHEGNRGITLSGREDGMRHLMATNLMKRMESSVYAFKLTLQRIKELIENTIGEIENYEKEINAGSKSSLIDAEEFDDEDFDFDDQNGDDFSIGRKVKIDLADMD